MGKLARGAQGHETQILPVFLSLRWLCFLLALGMFPESSEAEIHTPGLDAEQQGGAGLHGARFSSPPSLGGFAGQLPSHSTRVGAAGLEIKVRPLRAELGAGRSAKAGLESWRPEAWARLASRSPLSRELHLPPASVPQRILFPVADMEKQRPQGAKPWEMEGFSQIPSGLLGCNLCLPGYQESGL